MMVLAVRDPRERVHERHRLVVVRELELLDDGRGGRLPSGQRSEMRGELVGGEPRRAVAAMHGRQSEGGRGELRAIGHGLNL